MALYDDIAGFYSEIFPVKKIRLDFIDSAIGQDDISILDIGCASGELALALAQKGYRVTGIDLDEKMVQVAQRSAGKRGLTAEFRPLDMMEMGQAFPPASFDLALCFGNTLPHLDGLEKIKTFLAAVFSILKAGGRLVVQIVNYDRILAQGIKELPRLESENYIFSRHYDPGEMAGYIRFVTELTVKKSGQSIKNSHRLYPLTSGELSQAITGAGFSAFSFLGDEIGIPYSQESPGLLAIAEK